MVNFEGLSGEIEEPEIGYVVSEEPELVYVVSGEAGDECGLVNFEGLSGEE